MLTQTLFYSLDEGNSWTSFNFTDVPVNVITVDIFFCLLSSLNNSLSTTLHLEPKFKFGVHQRMQEIQFVGTLEWILEESFPEIVVLQILRNGHLQGQSQEKNVSWANKLNSFGESSTRSVLKDKISPLPSKPHATVQQMTMVASSPCRSHLKQNAILGMKKLL